MFLFQELVCSFCWGRVLPQVMGWNHPGMVCKEKDPPGTSLEVQWVDSQYRGHGFEYWLGNSAPACCSAQWGKKKERERRSPILPWLHRLLLLICLQPFHPMPAIRLCLPPGLHLQLPGQSLGVCVSIWSLQSNFSGRGVYLKGERGGYLHKAKHCGGVNPFWISLGTFEALRWKFPLSGRQFPPVGIPVPHLLLITIWKIHKTGQAPKPCSCRCWNWPLSPNTGFSFFYLIEVYLIYSVVLITAV